MLRCGKSCLYEVRQDHKIATGFLGGTHVPFHSTLFSQGGRNYCDWSIFGRTTQQQAESGTRSQR
jgi:hypothetical protein